ncbi:peptidoglycan DD-metalloendopeptidase family protein [Paenibacillus piri]|uniref:Peptidase M23 n=1 Tax=Paenibacillus piri TaxID=2547395 RepID=A0A4R5KET8_9BACL|nr:peptidoglycan DD-metalloendopeptidase family protein [Paenibacillus piri]TDF93861.1 peptidase M23 [Paenibacillus piri]
MRFNWFQNKLTFVIIPEAEAHASVTRVKMSRGALCAALLGMMLLSATAAYWYGASFHSAAAKPAFKAHRSDSLSRLEQDLNDKNKTIDRLQLEVFQLSRQAAEVRSQIEQLKQLEHELMKLTSKGAVNSQAASGAAADAGVQLAGSSRIGGMNGMGGPLHPVTARQMGMLLQTAAGSFTALKQEIAELQLRWMQSKHVMLAQQEQLQRIPSLWPTRSHRVTSAYGYRKDPFTDKPSFHRGIDIAGKMNDPVYASAKGTALTVGYDKFHGHHVVIDHGNGMRTWYMHLNGILVKRGETVERGQHIGMLGTSGRSTGPHLHYEIVSKGKSTDPSSYLPRSS